MEKRPNIVIFHTDQQRYDSLGCTGSCTAKTPHLDRLAAGGVVFDRHISAHPVCMPSRAALFSGRYPQGSGVVQNGIALPRKEHLLRHDMNGEGQVNPDAVSHVPTMMDAFAAAGYRTASFGKLHLTCTNAPRSCRYEESRIRWAEEPMERWHGPYYGFEHVELTIGHGEDYAGHYADWLKTSFPGAAKQAAEWAHRGRGASSGLLYNGVIPVEAHSSAWVADRAIRYIEQHGGNAEEEADPLFLFLGFPDPHFPFTPSRLLTDMFEEKSYEVGGESNPSNGERSKVEIERRKHPRAWTKYYGPEAIQNIARYEPDFEAKAKRYTDAMIHLIDQSVGRVLDSLDRQGLADQTIILFTSDHGDFLGDHGLVFKTNFGCRALNHVPFILKAPPSLAEGWPSRVPQVMSNIDVFPTLCELAGVPVPEGVQGTSVMNLLNRSGAKGVPALVACMDDEPEGHNYSIWNDRYRYTWYPATDERELFDHWSDAAEVRNIAALPENKLIVQALHADLLDRFMRTSNAGAGKVSAW